MNPNNTQHLHDHELYTLIDGEMASSTRQVVEAHLAECPLCTNRLSQLDELSRQVRAAAPECDECSSDGAFWMRLAGHLGSQAPRSIQRANHPWLRLIPSFGLAAIAFILNGMVTLALLAYTLINLGILPSVGSQLLQTVLVDSGLVLVLQKLGITDAVGVQSGLVSLTSAGISQDAVALFGVLFVLCLVLIVVIGLLFVWNATRVAAEDQETRGVKAHAVR